jgi:hypothetical protein
MQQANHTDSPGFSSSEVRMIEEAFHRKLMEGLEYGFFDISTRGERVKGRIEVFIEGGPSYKFAVRTEEASGSCGGSANEN